MKTFLIGLLFLVPNALMAQMKLSDWTMEAESKESKVSLTHDGSIDIIAPKGLTLWNKTPMTGNVSIEYDARIVVEEGNKEAWNRLSDLNCFWMAQDPKQKDGSVIRGITNRKGVFVNQYALSLYYMGYGGNHNSTTRFRRYNGDERSISQAELRPAILREFLDKDHLLKPNHWYHIKLEQQYGHVRYFIDGECLVDYLDIAPFYSGYFGFRTTLAHAQLKNFSVKASPLSGAPILLSWLGHETPAANSPQTFGVPFLQGELMPSQSLFLNTDKGQVIPHNSWTLASWPDGSVKWKAFAGVIPAGTESCSLSFAQSSSKRHNSKTLRGQSSPVHETPESIIINTGLSRIFLSRKSPDIIDSIVTRGVKACGRVWLEANGTILKPTDFSVEQVGDIRSTIKVSGDKFSLRLYAYRGSDEVKIVHTLFIDKELNEKGLSSLGLRATIPMRTPDHLRQIAFAKDDFPNTPSGLDTCRNEKKTEWQIFSVKPLISRRNINVDKNGVFLDAKSEKLASNLASWDGFRLSQLSPNAYSIRKRTTSFSPWIGTIEGHRAPGEVVISDSISSLKLHLTDFWQSYPSSIQVDNARSSEALASLWLWSPEAEAKSFEHYDTIGHSLEAAYEDIQPGMSTAEGIARTSTIYLSTALGKADSLLSLSKHCPLLPSPEYLHSRKAFGIWSLPDGDDNEPMIRKIADTYLAEQERNGWYGFFDYGDFMHTYDFSRGQWRFDVGGYAWDNTELATNAMLWYNFLREGKPEYWRMAVAMSRHTSEVDVYHYGPHAGLGTRHNVSHWGCGAKEARISQAFWNRFLYYLTADERTGDLMSEVRDVDTLLYSLDPMRLAQPRSEKYPCTAPARLRIGPDWMAYAGNWFTEWERTGNSLYYKKILAGMKSISQLPHGLFSGPKALGYDPATGIISWEGSPDVQNTNHLLSIMGGFEMMNEMMLSISYEPWNRVWLEHATHYKEKARTISNNKFLIPRLQAFSYWKTGNRDILRTMKKDMLSHPFSHPTGFSTNACATWTLDAIFLKEVTK